MLEKVIVPSVNAAAVGVKVTVRLTLCPATKVNGRLKLE